MLPGIARLKFPLPDDRPFDEIIDVRAPGEFAEDHMTGAINLPVLYDDERVVIGTQYKQESRFAAVKNGAALIARNIADHLQNHFADKPKDYHPLVYCWRGGQRSESLSTLLRAIGWQVCVVDGGYKSYRRHVISEIEALSSKLTFRIVNSLTGCGKTRLLHAIKNRGGQMVDLEGLANHKGSVFGGDPDNPQPAQKRFESLVYDELIRFDITQPVFVEAESPKIGRLNLPIPLWKKMRIAPVIRLSAKLEDRTSYLRDDYEDWLEDPQRILNTIDRLKSYHSPETIAEWKLFVAEKKWDPLIAGLLEKHYDRNYNPDGSGHYNVPETTHNLEDLTDEAFDSCAAGLLQSV